jgi:hypothetical protein
MCCGQAETARHGEGLHMRFPSADRVADVIDRVRYWLAHDSTDA